VASNSILELALVLELAGHKAERALPRQVFISDKMNKLLFVQCCV
jgi:hypothetical protein